MTVKVSYELSRAVLHKEIDRLTGERDQNAAQIVRIAELEQEADRQRAVIAQTTETLRMVLEVGLADEDGAAQVETAIYEALAAAAGDGGEDGNR